MNEAQRRALINSYTEKPWKRMNLATSLIAFSLDEGVASAIAKAESLKITLEEIIEASRGTPDAMSAHGLLRSVNNALKELLN